MHQPETEILRTFFFVTDTASALVIAGYCAAALITAVRTGRATEAQSLVARGALLGMSIKLVGTCLRTVELQTWTQIGFFAAILVLRTVLKKIFQWENRIAAREDPAGS